MSETSTLISCTGKITRADLAQLPTPPSTATHVPIGHAAVVEVLVETLSRRRSPLLMRSLQSPKMVWRCLASLIWPLALRDADSR
jgi:hypothetical protein